MSCNKFEKFKKEDAMNKCMVMLVCISGIVYGAEPAAIQNNNQLIIPYRGTLIQILKGTLGRPIIPTTDLVIVGRNAQCKLQPDNIVDGGRVGNIITGELDAIFVKHKECDSASDDDTYKPFGQKISKSWKNAYPIKLENIFFPIEEPCLHFGFLQEDQQRQYGYFPESGEVYYGDEAMHEAKEDLELCYETALSAGESIFLIKKEDRSIAIDQLSTEVGFPRAEAAWIAIEMILEYIEDNPHDYALIQLFVKKRSDFALYKKLLGLWLDEQ